MANTLPYLTSPGSLTKLLDKIKSAPTPTKFSLEYLNNTLNMKGGTANSLVPFLKKMGFLDSAGTPTPRYNEFRNEKKSSIALGDALKQLYQPIFDKNESAHSLPRDELVGLVVEYTGKSATDRVTQLMIQTFQTVNKSAVLSKKDQGSKNDGSGGEQKLLNPAELSGERQSGGRARSIHLGYTINLHLPATKDIEVFNAIFQSLRQHLLDETP